MTPQHLIRVLVAVSDIVIGIAYAADNKEVTKYLTMVAVLLTNVAILIVSA